MSKNLQILNFDITKKCSPSHCAFHSFSNGLDQFHYNDILFNLVELANQQGRMAKTNGIPMY